MSLTQREYSLAYESGKAARRGGKRIGDAPYRGKTERVRLLAEAWVNGFKAEDDARKAAAKAIHPA